MPATEAERGATPAAGRTRELLPPPALEREAILSRTITASAAEYFAGAVTTDSPRARACFGAAIRAVLGHRESAAHWLQAALDADEGLVLGHVLRGLAQRTLGRRDLLDPIARSLAAARASLAERGGSRREHAFVEALAEWHAGHPERAGELLDEVAAAQPHDLFALKMVHAARFIIGDSAGMRRSIERALPALETESPALGYALGCHAFTLVETGATAEAERVGRRAVELEPTDAWGAHAVSHVHFEERRPEDGIRWLVAHRDAARGCNNFAGHVYWHEALFRVQVEDHQGALALYDEHVAIYPPRDYRDVSNMTSLLFLLERAGVAVGDRWQESVERARARVGDHKSAFADAHYTLALARAGREGEARAFVDSMRRTLEADDSFDDCFETAVAREVGVPVCEAIAARNESGGHADRATWQTLSGQLHRLGGSNAQRALFAWLAEAADAPTEA